MTPSAPAPGAHVNAKTDLSCALPPAAAWRRLNATDATTTPTAPSPRLGWGKRRWISVTTYTCNTSLGRSAFPMRTGSDARRRVDG